MGHSREEVLSLLRQAEVAAVATAARDKLRTRMMHFAVDDDFHIYVATMKDDPKTLQISQHPNLSLLIYFPASDFSDSQEIEFIGVPHFVRQEQERQAALELVAEKSPIVKHLLDTGSTDVLDCIRVEPQAIKLRVFKEIVQGQPPTVINFPNSEPVADEWQLLKRKAANWYREMRPSSLTAAMISILLGSAVAFSHQGGGLHWGYFALALVAGVLIQAGANSMNDYFDHKSGNDEANVEFVRPFSGGSRLIQLGLLSPTEVLSIALLCFLIAGGIGIYLAWARGPLLLVLGAVGLISALFYTGRPFYWAKRGLGELVLGLNFGPLMVLGAYYVQTQSFSWVPVIAGVPVGLLILGVLFINEFPDHNADRAVGKKTLVVRLGTRRAVVPFGLFVIAAYVTLIILVVLGSLPLLSLLALVVLPATIMAIRYTVMYHSRPFDLASANALTITSHLGMGLAITWVFTWQGAGPGNIAAMAVLGAVFAGFIGYMFWHVRHQKRIFHGVKEVVG